jgi:SAM-dependent methyltransferase
MQPVENDVRAYWEAAPCGAKLSAAPAGSAAFFTETERERYRLEPFVSDFAEFGRWRGKHVLEIGVGTGVDCTQFARAGAHVSGVDLTETGASLTRERLAAEGLSGDIRAESGERLPFHDASFDLVYSWGVIHHAENPERVIAEARRVLRPGGEVRAMIYNRRSWFAYAVWARQVARGKPTATLTDALAHGLESPGTRGYTIAEARTLFSGFDNVRVRPQATAYDRRVAGPLATLSQRPGWFLLISATRPYDL